MPKFKYELANGQYMTMEGDSQPSDADVEQAAKDAGVTLKPVGEKSQPNEVTATLSSKPQTSKQESDLPATPGVMAILGAGLKQVPGIASRATSAAGEALKNSKGSVAGAIGGTVGAGLGASIGDNTPIGPFGGASLGAYVGHRTAKKVAGPLMRKAGKFMANVVETGYPESIYAGLRGVPAARKIAGAVGERLIPGVGNALLAADVGQTAYGLAKKPMESIGATDLFGRLAAQFTGGSSTYGDMLRALQEAEAQR